MRGWQSIVNRSLNMFTLIALGTAASYTFSVAATFVLGIFPTSFRIHGEVPVYFEAAAVIVTLSCRARFWRCGPERAPGGPSSFVATDSENRPPLLRRRHRTGYPPRTGTEGERLRVRPGERCLWMESSGKARARSDESIVTGESMPVEKTSGDRVTGGTVNGAGTFVVTAQRVGSDTLLAHIIRMVSERSARGRPFKGWPTLSRTGSCQTVILIAVATFVGWAIWGPEPSLAYALVNAVSVLIIACPCALGLATPMSIMVATGRGAMAGVLLRNAEALETLEKVTVLVLDKTGTLTEGKPALVTAEGSDRTDLLRLAASLEQVSEHPLAAAVVNAAKTQGLSLSPVTQFLSITGKGVQGIVERREVVVGNAALIAPGPLESRAEELRRLGETVMFVQIDGHVAGLLGVADPIKPSTKEAIDLLRREGIRLVMVTGDNETTAQAVAKKLGIDSVRAGILPDRKLGILSELQEGGNVVAMAGDGINDAPALAKADVGIAMGTGTDVAIESADITLLQGDLRGIVRARRLSRATMRNIRQNLVFAFGYNSIGIPIAAGLLYPVFGLLLSPMIASAAMTFSSLSVIANALRLRKTAL